MTKARDEPGQPQAQPITLRAIDSQCMLRGSDHRQRGWTAVHAGFALQLKLLHGFSTSTQCCDWYSKCFRQRTDHQHVGSRQDPGARTFLLRRGRKAHQVRVNGQKFPAPGCHPRSIARRAPAHFPDMRLTAPALHSQDNNHRLRPEAADRLVYPPGASSVVFAHHDAQTRAPEHHAMLLVRLPTERSGRFPSRRRPRRAD